MENEHSPEPKIILVTMDRLEGVVKFIRSDRKEATLPLEFDNPEAGSRIASITYSPAIFAVLIKTVFDDEILAELPTPDLLDHANGRPVVYLDQKDWSNISKSIYSPERVPGNELEAARELIEMAEAGKIILPMSAAHMSETCKWTSDTARYQHGLTLARLSRGWQMRDPLEVRRFELQMAFRSRFTNAEEQPLNVFTLEPGAIHSKRTEDDPGKDDAPDTGEPLPEPYRFMADALTAVSANFDTLLDTEAVPMNGVDEWVSRLQSFTDWLASEPSGPELRRQRIDLFFISDTRKEVAEEAFKSGITIENFHEWLMTHRQVDVKNMPSLSLFNEVLYEKFSNPKTNWSNNDLTDLMYLTCAAGYADFTVAERSLVSQLQSSARRLNRKLKVYRRLCDLLPDLRMAVNDSEDEASA
ncbi:hypothetical protein AB0N89_13580 [Amycolatopsis sp. NPDC089917]|uniref:hypothetical protein n=1 Tax=Amycolatopsis sp. NPDC089917 TaxID=3155187 RepID=UPI003412F62D